MDSATATVTMFSTQWCGYCHRLKAQMNRAGIEFEEIDIEADEAAALIVESANEGNRTVPTIRYSDGYTVGNPSIAAVIATVDELESALI